MVTQSENTFLQGPDQIKTADSLITWKPNGVVKLRSSVDDQEKAEYISVPTLLKLTADKYGEQVAIKYKINSQTREITFREYKQTCHTVAKAFLKLGLERYHAVCILGHNSPQWIYSAMAAILAGGFQAGIYQSNAPDACLHCLNISEANIVVVEDDAQLQKILAIKNKSPTLKAIIQYTGKPTVEGVYSWDEIMKIGEDESEDNLGNVLKSIAINECCTLIYTSGTTGLSKAVMLNHDNIISGARMMNEAVYSEGRNKKTLSYLPMNHIASQVMDIFLPLMNGSSIYIADKNCLKNTLVSNLRACRPNYLLGVPRVWEKLKDELMDYEMNCFIIKKWILSLAKHVALEHYKHLVKGFRYESLLYTFFQRTVYREMKSVIGLENSTVQITGGAYTPTEIMEYFYSLDIPISNGYGMSEISGVCTIRVKEDFFNVNSVGKVKPETAQVKILNPDAEGNGEICWTGRGTFMGYLNDEEKTMETIEPDGWMHSGDVGVLNSNCYLKITGRIKEIIITAGGENIPAPLIENSVKSNVPIISNAVLIGDQRKYLTMLITLKCETDPLTGMSLDNLTPETKEWCQMLGCNCSTIAEILENKPEQIYKAIQEGIDRANKSAISNAQKVQKFRILPQDFSMATEELGPTLKIKRSFVYKKYGDIIDEMYQ